jgi:hypothetical protein
VSWQPWQKGRNPADPARKRQDFSPNWQLPWGKLAQYPLAMAGLIRKIKINRSDDHKGGKKPPNTYNGASSA